MKPPTTIYRGFREADGSATVTVDGGLLSPERSLTVINHSPTGFEWGFGGSGPAQLALAILLDFLDDGMAATLAYQAFKQDIVSRLPVNRSWSLTGAEILAALKVDEA